MELKDYVQYYIGCECIWDDERSMGYQYEFLAYDCSQLSREPFYISSDSGYKWVKSIKPILRKLEDITNEESEEYNRINRVMFSINKALDQMKTNAATTNYLIKQGLDVFDLIHHNLAIDSKTLK